MSKVAVTETETELNTATPVKVNTSDEIDSSAGDADDIMYDMGPQEPTESIAASV